MSILSWTQRQKLTHVYVFSVVIYIFSSLLMFDAKTVTEKSKWLEHRTEFIRIFVSE